jgi:MFS family permease
MQAQSHSQTLGAGERVITGNIAARIDRLPLCRTQYLLAAITQLFWGVIIANDGLVARLYPFIWQPHNILTPLQFDVVLLVNIGVAILVGEYLGGFLSDRFGRKRILLLAAAVDGVFLWPIALTNSFGWLIVWNFLYGLGLGMVLGVNAVYLHEIVPPQARQRVAMRTQVIAIDTYLLLPGLLGFFWIPSHYQWAVFALAAAPILVLIPIGALFLPESPRWLEAKGRSNEADRIVSGWEADMRRRFGPLPEPAAERHPVVATQTVPIRELLRPPYRRRTVILWLCWFFGYTGMTYGYLSYLPTYLVGKGWSSQELFLVTTILAAPVTAATFFVTSAFQERLERRSIAMTGGLIAGVAALLLLVVKANLLVALVVLVVSPIGQTLWLFTMYNYTAAAYPTRLRSVGTGWTDGVGHLGSLTAPVVAGPLFVATAAFNSYAWILWVAIPGALFPALLIGRLGMRQRGGTLEELAT